MNRLSLTTPHLLVMVGTPGAGKTFFANQFAKTFAAPVVSYDNIRTVVSEGAPTHSKKEISMVSALAASQLDQLMLTKNTIIVDGGSDTRSERQALAKKARAHGYSTLFIWVQTDPATSKRRAINGIKGQSRLEDLLTPEQYESALRRFLAPANSEPSVVISGKHTYATQAKVILKKLAEPRHIVVSDRARASEKRPAADHRSFNRIKIL